jgi:DNA-binding transcriptional MerR regulator
MENRQNDLLSIGQFANAAQLSIKALRLYHEEGLLVPAFVDPSTNYRYYLTEQLWKARLIHLMRKMDMPLEEAKQVLELADKGRIRAVFQIQRYLESYQSRLQAALEVSNDLIAFLNKEKEMPFEVRTTSLPAQKVLAMELKMKAAGLGEKIQECCGKMWAEAERQGAKMIAEPMAIFHGPVNEEDDGPLQVAWPVQGELKPSDGITVDELSAGSYAVVDVFGADCDYPAIIGAYDAVSDWIANNGYQLVGSPREVYYTGKGADAHWQVQWQYR